MTAPPQLIEFEEGLRGDSAETEEQPWEFDLSGSAYYFRIGNVGGVTGMCFYVLPPRVPAPPTLATICNFALFYGLYEGLRSS